MKRILLLVALATVPAVATAAPSPSQQTERAFSGRIEAGAAFVSTTDQLFAQGDSIIGNLDESADRSEAVLPVVLFDLRYRSEASGTEVYLGTPLESSTVRLTLGVGQSWEGIGTLELAALASPWTEVWKDPYLTGVERDATWAREYGGRVGWRGMAGTGAEISYTPLYTDLADDRAGERLEALRRSGWTHEVEVGYRIPLLTNAFLTPSFAATFGDLDGEAEAFRRYEGRLAAQWIREQVVVNLFLDGGWTRYREEHPLLGKRRDDGSLGGGGMVTLPRLLGVPRLFADVVASYGARDSNLEFFDAHTVVGAVALGYTL